jgi:hypothetical protein
MQNEWNGQMLHGQWSKRKFHLGEFRTAAIPDVDMQELQRGERIRLDLVLELME